MMFIDATPQSTNIISSSGVCADPQAGCTGQECNNFGDVSAVVDAFRGVGFPCATICP